MKTYDNLILQIIQIDESLKYNGIIPLKITINFE